MAGIFTGIERVSSMITMKLITHFSDAELHAELERRSIMRKESLKDKEPREFYRLGLPDTASLLEKAAFVNKLSDAERSTMIEKNGHAWLLSYETPEELSARLSRTASYREGWDDWCDVSFYEHGKLVGTQQYKEKDARTVIADWEHKDWGEHSKIDCLGNSYYRVNFRPEVILPPKPVAPVARVSRRVK